MNIESIWITVLAISTPVAGLVGFSIQLRNVKKVRLENQKLELEISQLKVAAKASESQIKIPTNEEVEKYALDTRDIFFSRRDPGESRSSRLSNFTWSELAIFLALLLVTLYFVYDVYRLGAWIVSKF